MTITDRDRKIATVLLPIVFVAAYWFLVLAPKRDEAGKLGDQLAQAESTRDDAVARAAAVSSSKGGFAADFAEVLRIGKAIPSTVDMPSLLVQLDRAANGTSIGFNSIKVGQRTATQPAPPAAGGSSPPVAAGGEQAASAPGAAAEGANEASETSDEANAAAGADQPAGAAAGGAAPGLDAVPLDFTFTGDFFELAEFLHRLKRFVHVNDKRIVVDGRLMIVEGFSLKMKEFPLLEATMTAKVYLSPQAEGATGGATPAGPATAPAAAGAAEAAPAPAPTPTAAPTQ